MAVAAPSHVEAKPPGLDCSALQYPDIKLDGNCHGHNCQISADGYGVHNTKSTHFSQTSKYGFCGTCGTEALSGLAYWQVRCTVNVLRVHQFQPLCGVGVAAPLTETSACSYLCFDGKAFVVTLRTNGETVIAELVVGGLTVERSIARYTNPIVKTLGFLLDTSRKRFHVFDVNTKETFVLVEIYETVEIRPVFNVIQQTDYTHAHVMLEVEREEKLDKPYILEMISAAEKLSFTRIALSYDICSKCSVSLPPQGYAEYIRQCREGRHFLPC